MVTTTNGIIKMPVEGDTLTMHCARCEVVEGQFGEQVQFTDTRGDALFLPRSSADRQLGFICKFGEQNPDGSWDIHYGDVDGNTLVFSRDHNAKVPTKPFWSINRIVDADASHRPSLVAAAKAEVERVAAAKGLPKEELSNTMGKLPFDDVPPPTDADSPYGDEDGMPAVKATEHPKGGISLKETEINAAYDRAWNFALNVQGGIATVETVENAAVTLLIQYAQSGLFRG